MSNQSDDEPEFIENGKQIEEFEARFRNDSLSDEPEVEQYVVREKMFPQIQPSKIEQIQRQLEQYERQPPKSFQEECEDVIQSKNESLKDKKIRELVQKNRSLQLQYEKEKASRTKLEQQLNKVLKDTEDSLKNLDKQVIKPQKQVKDPLQQALKPVVEETLPEDFKAKFRESDKKVQEQRVKIQQLKSELNKASRVLQREIGDNYNLDTILLDENSWKGRAQQIEILKGKVRELTAKLANQSQYSETQSVKSSSTTSKKDDSNNKQLDLLKVAHEQLKQDYELLNSKFKAVSSRRTILEEQVKDAKLEYDKNKKILLDKSENDDKYIQALKQEIDKLKKQSNVETKIIYKPSDDDESKRLKNEIKYMKEEMAKNEKIIKELISEKVSKSSVQQSPVMQPAQVDSKLEEEVKILRRERDEFFKTLTKDQDAQKIIKDLTLQNVKQRNKIDQLQQK